MAVENGWDKCVFYLFWLQPRSWFNGFVDDLGFWHRINILWHRRIQVFDHFWFWDIFCRIEVDDQPELILDFNRRLVEIQVDQSPSLDHNVKDDRSNEEPFQADSWLNRVDTIFHKFRSANDFVRILQLLNLSINPPQSPTNTNEACNPTTRVEHSPF